MSEPFDPTSSLRPASDGLPLTTDMDPPSGLTAALAQSRQVFSGLEDLPIDEPDLEGQEALPAEEPPPPAAAVALPLEPAADDPVAAMQARLALLEAEQAALRASSPPPLVPPPAPVVPPTVSEDIYTKIADRFQANFASMAEQRADESDQQFEQRRARGFAETIVAAVYEDLLPTEAVQARLQPTIERVAQDVSTRTVQRDRETTTAQSAQDRMVAQAVAAARQAGYDVHLPTSLDHGKSQESVLFWQWAAQQVDPALPVERQISGALALMPPKTAPAPSPPPAPRAQPMGRGGSGPGLTPAPAQEGQEYQPMTMGAMLGHHQQVRRIGAA